MTECFSARCQQDRKLVRREFNKWTKNLLFQIGLETITKNHFDFDVNVFNQTDDERIPIDFNPEQECLFCINRQEYLNNKKTNNQINEHHHPITETIIDDDENAPLDLSLKSSTNNLSLITPNSRTNIKHRPLFDIKSDIPAMYGQEEFDRFMSDMIASQLDFSSQSFLNMNLFPTSPTIPLHYSQINKKSSTSLQDTRIAQLAKQMAYERMLQEIDYQRYPSTNKKSKISNNLSSSSSILTESIHVNHILNDVMMRILHEMFEKQQTSSVSQPRASRKGELLFVKKQNVNNDEQYNTNIFNHFNNNYNIKQQQQHKHHNKVNPSSSSSSSTSSVSSTRSSSIHIKNKHKTKLNQSTNYIPKGRSNEIINNNNNNNNNNKITIGTDGKQIRPKRGQYRRYESEQLAKAVAAVLSNEMSVHKAGSFFGVPHSTLEYKVKERNTKVSSTTKNKNESTSSISINDNDNNNTLHHGENNDDDDDKSSKELTTCLPPSNSSTNNDHQDTIDDENESNDDDDDDDDDNNDLEE